MKQQLGLLQHHYQYLWRGRWCEGPKFLFFSGSQHLFKCLVQPKGGQFSSLTGLFHESGATVTQREQKPLKTAKMQVLAMTRAGQSYAHEHTLTWKLPYSQIPRPLPLPST